MVLASWFDFTNILKVFLWYILSGVPKISISYDSITRDSTSVVEINNIWLLWKKGVPENTGNVKRAIIIKRL